jgi:CHRD domain
MRRLLAVLVLVIAGLTTASVAGAATSTTFVAVLSPVSPVGDCSSGQGVAVVTVTEEGTVEYRLVVANLENVTAAHIHRGSVAGGASTAGGVAFLYNATSPVDVHDKVVLASGTLTADDLIGITLEDLTDELLNGASSFYVNVHTSQCPEGAIAGDLLLKA